jgi:hypothetical protein
MGLLLVGDTNASTNSVEPACIIQTSFVLLVMGHESMHGVGSPFGSVHVSIMETIVPYFHLSVLLRDFCLQVRLLKSTPIGCHCLISFFHFIFLTSHLACASIRLGSKIVCFTPSFGRLMSSTTP